MHCNSRLLRHGSALSLLALGSFLSPSANAQWSSDPAVNFAVRAATSDQNQPLVAPTPDGGAWISWFDGIASGWDVRVQKLDAAGNELLPTGGVLVLDRSFSSTQGYGIDVDAAGNALLTFRDDNFANIQVTAAKVTPAGTLPWGAGGVQLTSTTGFIGNVKIAGTSDGGAVVAWSDNGSIGLQKLDASGAPQWMPGVTLSPPAGNYSVADLHDAGTDAILSVVHQTGSQFFSPKHIIAQKFDSTGAALWGVTPVSVFDGGSLQIGNFPPFVPDGSGGGVFAWYSTTPLQCFVQRVDSAGAELFAHNGVEVSTNASQVRTDPSVSFDQMSGDSYVFWTEQNTTQSMRGVSGQRIDNTGARLWGSNGATLVPIGTNDIGLVRSVVGGASGALAIWSEAPTFGQDQLFAAHVNAAGTTDAGPVSVASTTSGKSRLSVGKSALGTGFAILAWSDQRTDGGDIYAQNVNFDGTLGGGASSFNELCSGDGGNQMGCTNCPCSNNSTPGTVGGCLNSAGTSAHLLASGDTSVSLPSGSTSDLRFSIEDAPPTAFCILNSGDALAPGNMANPCFGMGSGAQAAAFDGLRCAITNTRRHGGRSADAMGDVGVTNNPWGGEGGPPVGLAVAGGGFAAGQTRFFQVINRDDPMSVCMRALNTSQAVEVTFTP